MLSQMLRLFKKSFLFKRFELYLNSKINNLIEKRVKERLGLYIWEYEKSNDQLYVLKKLENDYLLKCYFDSKLAELIFTTQFEREEIRFVKKFLKNGGVFIDIGANIGLFSLYAAYNLKKKGHVYAFEPTEKIFERLIENITLNEIDNVSSIKKAISNSSGKATLNTSLDGYDAWNSLGVPTSGASFSSEVVDTITLDEFVSQEKISAKDISLIKIDVEGWEIPVIEGGRKLFSGPDAPVLMVEFTEENARAAGFNCQDLYSIVESLGYLWYKFENNKLIRATIKPYFHYENLIATKNPKHLLDLFQQE